MRLQCSLLPSPFPPFTICAHSRLEVVRWLLCCVLCSACFAACCYCMTAGWGAIEVLMDVSSRRLTLVAAFSPPRTSDISHCRRAWRRRWRQQGRGELGSWTPATVEFIGDQLCAACCLWKRKSEAIGELHFSFTRLAAKKLLLVSHLVVIGVLTYLLFGLCDCDVTIRTAVGDGTTKHFGFLMGPSAGRMWGKRSCPRRSSLPRLARAKEEAAPSRHLRR